MILVFLSDNIFTMSVGAEAVESARSKYSIDIKSRTEGPASVVVSATWREEHNISREFPTPASALPEFQKIKRGQFLELAAGMAITVDGLMDVATNGFHLAARIGGVSSNVDFWRLGLGVFEGPNLELGISNCGRGCLGIEGSRQRTVQRPFLRKQKTPL